MTKRILAFNFIVWIAGAILLPGCGPKFSYPADRVPHAIEKICRDEYQINVIARVVGKTAGALLYLDTIVDKEGQIPKEAHDKMGKVLLVLTRVSLSTDRPIDYCVVVIRDKIHDNQLVVTRSIDDAKRANADMLGMEESINRITYGQEKFERNLTEKRAFVLKDVKFEDFLASQMTQRIRYNFMKNVPQGADAKDDEMKQPVIVDGDYLDDHEEKSFRFSVIAFKADDADQMILNIFKVINQVLQGYRFTNFSTVEIQDYLNRQKLVVDKDTVLAYQKKNVDDDYLLQNCLTESQSIQEAFKLFGFKIPKESQDNTDPNTAAASAAVTP